MKPKMTHVHVLLVSITAFVVGFGLASPILARGEVASNSAFGVPQASTVSPFWGTVWISDELITPQSPTDFISIRYRGVEQRRTYDRRSSRWLHRPSHVFEARYQCGRPLVEVVVNSEFSRKRARVEARRYGRILGQLPSGVRASVEEIWVHKGNQPAGGGNNSLLVHTHQANRYKAFIEEIILHEAAHTTLDPDWGGKVDRSQWETAALLDGRLVSAYAQDEPQREDVAESYVAYVLWAELNREGKNLDIAEVIQSAIPHRLDYLSSLGPDYLLSARTCPS